MTKCASRDDCHSVFRMQKRHDFCTVVIVFIQLNYFVNLNVSLIALGVIGLK